ncbi:MAG TPA: hypothetical protein VET85_04410, partial [Stellaceae bacterium]|nr:hypothetical protein [Stellaceae bacterium]
MVTPAGGNRQPDFSAQRRQIFLAVVVLLAGLPVAVWLDLETISGQSLIGGEANLAARLQAIAEAGGIVMSYETYALVR